MSGVLQRAFDLDQQDLDLVQACLDELLPGRSEGMAAALDSGTPLATILGLSPQLLEVLYGAPSPFSTPAMSIEPRPHFVALCMLDGRRADHWMGLGICARVREMTLDSALVAFSTALSLRSELGGAAVPHCSKSICAAVRPPPHPLSYPGSRRASMTDAAICAKTSRRFRMAPAASRRRLSYGCGL